MDWLWTDLSVPVWALIIHALITLFALFRWKKAEARLWNWVDLVEIKVRRNAEKERRSQDR